MISAGIYLRQNWNMAAKEEKEALLSSLPSHRLSGLPGGTDSLWAQAVQPRPISSPHSDKMEGLWRRNSQVCKQGGRREKIHTRKKKKSVWAFEAHLLSEGERGLVASGSAATAGKLNKRCHTVALLCRFMSVKASELCTQLGVAPAWPGIASEHSRGLKMQILMGRGLFWKFALLRLFLPLWQTDSG